MPVLPLGTTGVPTVGVTDTVFVTTVEFPLHPVSCTPIWAVPEKVGLQFTVAVEPVPLTVPAVAGDNDQTKEDATDEQLYVTPLLPWQTVRLPVGVLGIWALELTMTAVVTMAEPPLHPTELTPIVAAPEKAMFQLTVPVVPLPLILPAEEGLMDQV